MKATFITVLAILVTGCAYTPPAPPPAPPRVTYSPPALPPKPPPRTVEKSALVKGFNFKIERVWSADYINDRDPSIIPERGEGRYVGPHVFIEVEIMYHEPQPARIPEPVLLAKLNPLMAQVEGTDTAEIERDIVGSLSGRALMPLERMSYGGYREVILTFPTAKHDGLRLWFPGGVEVEIGAAPEVQ